MFGVNIIWYYIIGNQLNFQFVLESQILHSSQIYLSPAVRITSFLVGMIGGWYMIQHEQQIIKNNNNNQNTLDDNNIPAMVLLFKLFVIVMCLLSPLLLMQENLSPTVTVTIHLLARISMASAICWAILYCVENKIELGSSRWFRQLGPLTYAYYLIHPLLIKYLHYISSFSFYYDDMKSIKVKS